MYHININNYGQLITKLNIAWSGVEGNRKQGTKIRLNIHRNIFTETYSHSHKPKSDSHSQWVSRFQWRNKNSFHSLGSKVKGVEELISYISYLVVKNRFQMGN